MWVWIYYKIIQFDVCFTHDYIYLFIYLFINQTLLSATYTMTSGQLYIVRNISRSFPLHNILLPSGDSWIFKIIRRFKLMSQSLYSFRNWLRSIINLGSMHRSLVLYVAGCRGSGRVNDEDGDELWWGLCEIDDTGVIWGGWRPSPPKEKEKKEKKKKEKKEKKRRKSRITSNYYI